MPAKVSVGPTAQGTEGWFQTVWASLELGDDRTFPATRTLRPRAEVAPPQSADLTGLERLTHLERGAVLGRGGMGEVFAANQRTLDREVAVKVPRDTTGERARHVLREAWAMGALEHPNVVPVHELGLDEEGAPQIVMKKISGTTLHERLHETASDETPEEALEANLHALTEVARALEFAHARGIVHRDVKPENVMLGEYGEVYLLDWGIAVATREEHRDRLRMASDVVNPEGTPSYMAPEMVYRGLSDIDERTDVYLLGGLLHEILTGHPPHTGETLMAVIHSVLMPSERRDYPASAPRQLVAIAEKALTYTPTERFASARAFRLAIEEAQRHQASESLAGESAQRLEQLGALLRAPASDEQRQAARDLFTEGLFACEQALRTWSDNALALQTRRELVVTMARYELSAGRLDGAEEVLARIDAPPEDLTAQLADARAEKQREDDELASRRHDDDLSVAATTRARVCWVLAVTTSAYMLGVKVFSPAVPTLRSGLVALAGTSAILVGAVVLAWRARSGRGAILGNAVNREIITSTIAILAGVVLMRAYGMVHGYSYEELGTWTLLIWAVSSGIMSASIDIKFVPSALAALFAWIGCVAVPPQALYIGAAGYFVSFGALAVMWMRDVRRGALE